MWFIVDVFIMNEMFLFILVGIIFVMFVFEVLIKRMFVVFWRFLYLLSFYLYMGSFFLLLKYKGFEFILDELVFLNLKEEMIV